MPIANLKQSHPDTQLWVSYSWSNNNHGISGHLFEVIDYYFILSKKYKTGILLTEEYTHSKLEFVIREKYNFNDEEVQDILDATVFVETPSLASGSNIIFTDGCIDSLNQTPLLFDNIFVFLCGKFDSKIPDNFIILGDDRIYPKEYNAIHYVKKILFSRLKRLKRPALFPGWLRTIMVYGTKNCRDLSDKQVKRVSNKYKGYHVMVLTNSENKGEDSEWIKYYEVPIADLFNRFIMYYYTPTRGKYDCSPRFIAECRHYNKQVVYDSKINDEYLEHDLGLKYRMQDIEEDFDSLDLKENDDIFRILDDRLLPSCNV
jgi:hypothetical protein